MNIAGSRDLGHALLLLVFCLSSLLMVAGCHSGVSGHAPGLAGQQALDPGTFTYPLAYIKRPPLATGVDVDVRDLITSTTGGDVYIRDTASAGGAETNITKSITGGLGDVRDLDVSMDGKKLVFSLRLPLDTTKPNTDVTQPNWHVYQYDPVAKIVTQLTDDSTVAGHDVGAHYLPDGRIVFSSTRQSKTRELLIDEGRPQYPAQTDDRTQPIFLLHVMNADGTGIHQISFNTNHDFAPSVLANGQIVFSRYESINGDQISLYRANPDGTGLELYYGENSHATGASTTNGNSNVIQFLNPRQRADGKLVTIVRPFKGTQQGGDILQIDADAYVECDQPAVAGGTSGTCAAARPAQMSATSLGVSTDANAPSAGGRFASVYPLFDGTNRMLVSWAPCLVQNTSVTPATTQICTSQNTGGAVTLAPPAYAIWVYDIGAGTLTPVLASQPGLTIVDPVILEARTPAVPFIADSVSFDSAAPGILSIRSVYDFDGTDTVGAETAATGHPVPNIAALADPAQATAAQRPARFIRIEKAVEIPDRTVRKLDANIFGPANVGMREILAYGPIEPDGSVQIQVPANVPFTIEILDVNARRIGAPHTSWLQLLPGETKSCNGCHTGGSNVTPSHGRSGLTNPAYAGAAAPGTFPDTTASFPAEVTGDTMAQARAENTCQSTANCSQIPGIDVNYTDVWTNPAVRTPDAPFSYAYADLTTQKPVNAHCAPWDPECRSNIDYPLHIQPIWSFVRQMISPTDHVTVLSDHTCTLCHNPVDSKNAIQVPMGQLDLTASASSNDATIFTSYRELLFPHNEQTLNMGVLADYPAPAPGAPDPLAPPMMAGSANNSYQKFFRLFDGTYQGMTQNHSGFLTAAELRLISEWLDIGDQYYNDPFVAPAAN